MRVKIVQGSETFIIAIPFRDISYLSAHTYRSTDSVIFLTLGQPPSFECETSPGNPRRRLSCLPWSGHARIAPYLSTSIRLVCSSRDDLRRFRQLSIKARAHTVHDFESPVERRGLFLPEVFDGLELQLRSMNWCVAFQVESIVRARVLDIKEMLELMTKVRDIVARKGKTYAASFLRHFKTKAMAWNFNSDTWYIPILQCFLLAEVEYEKQSKAPSLMPTDNSLFQSFHVIVTPTAIVLDGPFVGFLCPQASPSDDEIAAQC